MKKLAYYTEGDHLYQNMLDAISGANKTIDIESYIFSDDEIGHQFLSRLFMKSLMNIKVRVLIDAVGSNRIRNRRLFKKYLNSHFQLKWFNPWSIKKPMEFNRRNHRKLLIVDDQYCFLGGFNIHKQSSKSQFGIKRWKDSHISFQGSLVNQLKKQFDLMWNGKYKLLKVIQSHNNKDKIIPNQTRDCRIKLRCQLIQSINNSLDSIQIATPYFVPDSKTLKALVEAANQGVKVSLMVPKYSDHALLKFAALWYYKRLLGAGIQIYEFTARMMHSKYIICDQNAIVIGSANMDYRSFFTNYELMLFSSNKQLLEYLTHDFQACLASSDLVKHHHLKNKTYSFFIPSIVAYFMRRWL